MNDMTAIEYIRPGLEIAPQGVGGYDQNWYPVMMSADLGAGEAKSTDFMDGRVLVYRGASGRAYVRSAYCRHLGADLGVKSKVVGEDIRCPFHAWRYDAAGQCVHIPSGDDVPAHARLFCFPTAERWGLIWAFNGEQPLYDTPHFTVADDELETRTFLHVELPQDHWVLLSNSCDFQHLHALHGMTVLTRPGMVSRPDPHHFEYPVVFEDPKYGRMEQFCRVFGTNVLTLGGQMQGQPLHTMFAAMPLPGNRTQGWTIISTRKGDGSEADEQRVQMMLGGGEAFFRSLVDDDDPIMRRAHFRNDSLSASDWALAEYFDYVRNYPRAHPSAKFIV
ncbi:MAG: Rieske 2Fe-2S domain-containing protein [Gammaproteobacteria bacterium]|nr:Rieske 2Fe-2S domain-containing protein [Gammaproteobacteria bacterium]